MRLEHYEKYCTISPARQNVYYGRKLEPTLNEIAQSLGAQNVLFVTNSSLANTTLSASIVEAVKKFGVYQVTGLRRIPKRRCDQGM